MRVFADCLAFSICLLKTFRLQSLHADLQVKVRGTEHRETILLLHGGPGTPDYLDEVAACLAGRFRAVTFDQRGTGQSLAHNRSYAPADYLADINAIADHLGAHTFHLFGHSWGGLLAQWYARHHAPRLRSLFLCNSVPGPGQQWAAMILEESVFIIRKATLRDLLRISSGWLRGELLGSDTGWQQFYKTVWKYYFSPPTAVPPLASDWVAGIRAEPVRGTVRAVLKAPASLLAGLGDDLQVPVGVLYGERDFLQRSQKPVVERFPAAAVYGIKGAGHVSWTDNPAAFRAVMDVFYGKFKTG